MRRIETPRLVLRELGPADVPALFTMLGDPEVMRHYPATRDRAGTEAWLAVAQAGYRGQGHGLWAAVSKQSGQVVGQAGVIGWSIDGRRELEVGYLLRRDAWGQGFASEAAAACRDWAFDALGCARVISLIAPANAPSRRVAERNGMRLGRETRMFERDVCVYGIGREEPREPASATWLRPERGGDAEAIRGVQRAAFGGRVDEARIVDRLRGEPVAQVSLVAVHAGHVVGHVLLSPVWIESESHSWGAAPAPLLLGLGPVAVAPACQGRGIGAWLVTAALARAPTLGAAAVFVLGAPRYYGRFGFDPAGQHGLRYEGAPFAEAFQLLELAPGALAGRAGRVRYSPAFEER